MRPGRPAVGSVQDDLLRRRPPRNFEGQDGNVAVVAEYLCPAVPDRPAVKSVGLGYVGAQGFHGGGQRWAAWFTTQSPVGREKARYVGCEQSEPCVIGDQGLNVLNGGRKQWLELGVEGVNGIRQFLAGIERL